MILKIDNLLIIFWISITFSIACSSSNIDYTTDSCIIFEQKKFWYKDAKESYDNWGVPISLQLAIINQESSFKQYAKPKRDKFLGIIPWDRPSSAFGYAQVIDSTWEWYKTSTLNSNASRANFKDVTDFIGWYVNKSEKILGIQKNDAFNQYLAYHEGHTGWKNKNYINKNWLINAAKNVNKNNKIYNKQLIDCENKLNKRGIFGFL